MSMHSSIPLTRRRLGLTAAGLCLPFIARGSRADEPLRLRCSLDTAPAHLRNVAVTDFLKNVEAGSDGRIRTELFSSGALYADLNVSKACCRARSRWRFPAHGP